MTNLMKLATAVPALALLSACATTTPTTPTTPAESVTEAAYDRMAPAPYTCEDGSTIRAKQSIDKKQVMLNATLPKINWSQQPVILNGGIQGDTASYANTSNPEAAYAWHMQGDKGIFAVKWANGKEYKVNCKVGR